MKMENAQRRVIRAIFSGKKIETQSDILEVNILYTMFVHVEVLKELSKELGEEIPFRLLQSNKSSEQCITTRWASKGFFPPTYNRTFATRKSF